MAQKITRFMLIALVLSLAFGKLLSFKLYSLPLYLPDFIIAVILLFNFRALFTSCFRLSLGLRLFLLGLIFGWLQALWLYPTSQLFFPFLYTLRLLLYFLFFAWVRRSKTRLAPFYFYLSGVTAVVIALAQYILIPDMRLLQYLGWDDHLNRVVLPFFDPAFSSAYFSLFALYALAKKNYYLVLFALPAILLSYARATWISLLLVLGRFMSRSVLVSILLIFGLILIILPKGDFGEGTNLLRTYSISARLNHDLDLLRSINYHAILGVGYNTLSLHISPSSVYSYHANSANNSYLTLLLTTGILGSIGVFMLIRDLFRFYPHRTSLSFILLMSFFNNALLYPAIIIWLTLLVAEKK